MSYVVLARRWRPRHFEEVVGQEHVARTLKNAIAQDRVAHAFLFCGPRGVGKTSTARILAKALNCKEGPTETPCYGCVSCQEISAGSAMDVIEIDGASNRGVNEIRELREGVHYAPSRDRYKVYIIDEVHMLTTEAFNALLKTLEEPPPHVKFIFATTEPQRIPVTILSRCQRFDFKRISGRRIVAALRTIAESEGIRAEPGALALIANQADGGMRDALSLTDQIISFCGQDISEAQVAEVLGVAGRRTLFALTASLLSRDVEGALRILDEVNQAGYDLVQFAGAVVSHLRDLAVVRVANQPEGLTDMSPEELATAVAQVQLVDVSVFTRMFNLMVGAAEEMARSSYPKLLFEMTMVKLAAVEPLMPMELVLRKLEALEAGVVLEDSWTPPTPTSVPPPSTPSPSSGGGAPGGSALRGHGTGLPSSTRASSPFESAVAVPPSPGPSRPAVTASPAPPPPVPLERIAAPPPVSTPAPLARIPGPTAPTPSVSTPAPTAQPQSIVLAPESPPRSDDATNQAVVIEHGLEPIASSVLSVGAGLTGGHGAVGQWGETLSGAESADSHETARRLSILSEPVPTSAVARRQAMEEDPEEIGIETEAASDPSILPPALEDATAREVWRELSTYMHANKLILAHYYDHARILSVRPGQIRLAFEADLLGLVTGRNQTATVAWVARHLRDDLWPGPWGITVEALPAGQGDLPGQWSLAEERKHLFDQQKMRAREAIRGHMIVAQAMELFQPAEVKVILDADEAL